MANRSKGDLRRELREQKGVTNAAVEVAGRAALTAERWHETADAAFDLAKEAVEVAREAGELAGWFADRLEERDDWDVLDAQELQVFAELHPGWVINSGICNGVAQKIFTRILHENELEPERRTGGSLEHDTFKLLDGYPPIEVLRALETWGGSGDCVRSLGSFYFVLNMPAETAGPVTYQDYKRVREADKFFDTLMAYPAQESEVVGVA